MDDGFEFSELSEFTKEVLDLAQDLYPKETKKFLKREAVKGAKVAKEIAKSTVNKKTGNYLKKFKSGKVYNYGKDTCVRFYNSSPHGHLIEKGHKNKDGTFTLGKYVLQKAGQKFEPEFSKNIENFAEEILNKGLK